MSTELAWVAPNERRRRKGNARQTIFKAWARPRAKARRVKKPESVTSATNLDICVTTVSCTRDVWPGKEETKKTETTAAVQGATTAVQGAMVETWEYIEDDHVFAFGEAVIAAVQRPETHICIDSGASRSVCPFGHVPMCQRKAQHRHCFRLMDLQLSSVGTRKCTGRSLIRLVRRSVSTTFESSVLFPVASVSSLEGNETSVVFFLLWRSLVDSTTHASTIAISILNEFHTRSCRNAVEHIGCSRIDESRSMTSHPRLR